MPLVDLKSIAIENKALGLGLGAFNVVHIESAEKFVEAAERANRPVVLQISENAAKFHGRLAPITLATISIAQSSSVPVVVHLDHAESRDLISEAVRLGVTSVMFDGSKLDYNENVRITRQVVDECHAAGISVEAELGEVGGKNGVHDPSARTEPSEAATFVADTGVDLLAVAVGSSHAMTTRDATLDTTLISQIAAAVPVPLVLHGSSGVSDAAMKDAIKAGITKVNVSTHLNVLFTDAVRKYLAENPEVVDTRKYLKPGYESVTAEVERLLRWYASA
jgi:ketose-bisphosphate aldolase